MKLLTKAIEKKLPMLYEGDKTAYVKYFTPWTGWTWYVTEAAASVKHADGTYSHVKLSDVTSDMAVEDVLFYGYVEGFEKEWGCFSLEQLKEVKGPFGLKIERDLYWEPKEVGIR